MTFLQRKAILIMVILALAIGTNSQDYYRKIIHNTDPEAKCLDGSPGMLYLNEGTQKDKFLLYFIGGGFCGESTLSGTLQSCYKRSKSQLGSSTLWPEIFTDQMGAEGLISSSQPLYKNWTKVLFAYCDGALHQGDSQNFIPYKDAKLYFRGNRIVRSHFKYLVEKLDMDKATKIMLTGGSAGGIASYLWGNYLKTVVQNSQSVYVIPDSGLFLNSKTYSTNIPLIQQQISTLMSLAHGSQKTPLTSCNADNPGQEWKCLFIEKSHNYLEGKYLFINSEYDQWAITNILKIKCLIKGKSGQTPKNCTTEEMKAIQDYRTNYLNFVQENMRVRKDWAFWSIACSQHVYQPFKTMYDSDLQRVPMKTGMTVKDAIQKFILEDQILWTVDPNPWPSNEGCAY